MSSQFGSLLKISTWGESHGKAIGVVIDGFPANFSITDKDIQKELNKRKPGQSNLVTQRAEGDCIEVLSGVFNGKTTGAPISLVVFNQDQKSKDYDNLKDFFRPSHADFTYTQKYLNRDYRGGGRSSARETIGRVAAGAFAKKWLAKKFKTTIVAYVKQVGSLKVNINPLKVTSNQVEKNPVRCPHPLHKKMEEHILKIRKSGDSIGGVIEFAIQNIPAGLGEPIFDRVEALLGYAFLSIPATKGFEFGSGFDGVTLKGSEHNDLFIMEDKKVKTTTNYSGGIQGGITNGMPIVGRIAFKPTATILKPQKTINLKGQTKTLQVKGRHDACVLPRAVVIVEAMAALVLMDLALHNEVR